MLSELVFEQIEGNFWYAAYGPFRVIMMKDTGYVNATKLCKSGGKDYKDWSRLNGSHELIHAIENELALENTCGSLEYSDLTLPISNVQICTMQKLACKQVQTRNRSDEGQQISGTYCHPDLIPHIACWISPDFALKVSKIVNGYITMEYKAHLAAAKQELHVKQLALEHATELREAATLDAYRAQQQVEQKDQQVQQKDQQVQQKDQQLQQKEHRHQVWSSTHGFTMLRLNNPDAKLPYYAVRCKRGDMSGAIKKVRAKHPHSIMIYQNSYVANPINLYNRLKNCGFLCYSRNYCGSYVREGELITKLGELCTIVK